MVLERLDAVRQLMRAIAAVALALFALYCLRGLALAVIDNVTVKWGPMGFFR